MKPALFIDKDGTLIENVPYNVDPDRIRLVQGMDALLRHAAGQGWPVFVISNQGGVALGRFDIAALGAVAARLRVLAADVGGCIAGSYFCPHHPAGTVAPYACVCACRKPMPGLLLRAATAHNIDLEASWMMGDILDDVEAGNRAGCRTLLFDVGHETEWRAGPWREPDAVARTPAAAIARLCARATRGEARR